MTPDERAAYRPMLERFKRSPEVREAITQLQWEESIMRILKRAIRRKRIALVLEIIAAMLCGGFMLFCLWKMVLCAWKLTEILAR